MNPPPKKSNIYIEFLARLRAFVCVLVLVLVLVPACCCVLCARER